MDPAASDFVNKRIEELRLAGTPDSKAIPQAYEEARKSGLRVPTDPVTAEKERRKKSADDEG